MSRVKKIVKDKMTDAKRIEFAKQLEYFYEASHADTRRIFGLALLKGIGTGLGVFLGGTVVIALLLWILSQFNSVPFVKEITEPAQQSIDKNRE